MPETVERPCPYCHVDLTREPHLTDCCDYPWFAGVWRHPRKDLLICNACADREGGKEVEWPDPKSQDMVCATCGRGMAPAKTP